MQDYSLIKNKNKPFYFTGIVTIPIALRNFHKRIPLGIEYKLAIGAVSMMTISYFAGIYAKNRCERNLKKQLLELIEADN